jgi:hypothetical protein
MTYLYEKISERTGLQIFFQTSRYWPFFVKDTSKCLVFIYHLLAKALSLTKRAPELKFQRIFMGEKF